LPTEIELLGDILKELKGIKKRLDDGKNISETHYVPPGGVIDVRDH
jgi:hypothetical protein